MTETTKEAFLKHVTAIYRIGNLSDSDNRPSWTKPEMAGLAGCSALDSMLREMETCGALSADERQAFYDNM